MASVFSFDIDDVSGIVQTLFMATAKKSLAETHPALAKEAHGWDPHLIFSDSGQVVSWKCKENHTWGTKVNYRVKRNSKCGFCLNQKVWVGFNDFATTHPEMLHELVDSDGTDFVAGSMSKVRKWKCNLGHQYEARPQYRTVRKQGCPFCSGRQVLEGFNDLSTTHPQIASEAFDFDPKKVSAGSHQIVKWKCQKGHIYHSVLKQRTVQGSNCSVCSGDQVMSGVNDIATTHPELAAQANGWDPKTLGGGNNKKVSWNCVLGHSWEASPNSRTNMESGCPVCDGRKLLSGFNDLNFLFPGIASEANGWDPELVLAGTHQKMAWICSSGHTWTSVVKSRTGRGDGCPSCAKFGFDPSEDGYLYFLAHPDWEMLQIGITNNPENRLNDHKRLGWEVLEIKGPMDGLLARGWEISILQMLKKRGVRLAPDDVAGKFSGYTEAWMESSLPVKSIEELMRMVEEDEDHG